MRTHHNPNLNPMRVVIVGAGFSGSMVAYHLLSNGSTIWDITIVDARNENARGMAYDTNSVAHLLNVPARLMGANPTNPNGFYEWLCTSGYKYDPNAFVPRALYQKYLNQIMAEPIAHPDYAGRFRFIRAEVVEIKPDDSILTVTLKDRSEIQTDRIVLALGNMPYLTPAPLVTLTNSPDYHENPWCTRIHSELKDGATIAVVGSGLSALDLILDLESQGFRGNYIVVSRHGLLPKAHPVSHRSMTLSDQSIAAMHNGPLSALREFVRLTYASGLELGDWVGIIDAVRPEISKIWNSWPITEKRRFLRHLRAYWEIHRHRAPAQSLATLEQLSQSGRLKLIAGRVTSARPNRGGIEIKMQPRGMTQEMSVRASRVVNCTGPGADISRQPLPLLSNLFSSGMARPDQLGIGIDSSENGALIDAHGHISSSVFTLGPMRKGTLWESTAVRELRMQALRLCQTLNESILLDREAA